MTKTDERERRRVFIFNIVLNIHLISLAVHNTEFTFVSLPI
jgi:hypothetical protein